MRQIRKSKGFNLVRLGKELGISQGQISKYENGVNRLTLSRASDFCKVCNITLVEFVGGLDVQDAKN